jgi:hypothetical protein
VNDAQVIGGTCRKAVFLTLLGFVTLVLLGPVLALAIALVATFFSLVVALASVFLPFLLVGLLVWVPFQMLHRGPRAGWECVRDQTRAFYQAFLAAPCRVGLRWCAGAVHLGEGALEKVRYVGRVLAETLCGAAVGALLAALTGTDSLDVGPRVLLGMMAGGLVGALVGAAQARPARAENP